MNKEEYYYYYNIYYIVIYYHLPVQRYTYYLIVSTYKYINYVYPYDFIPILKTLNKFVVNKKAQGGSNCHIIPSP